MSSTLAGTPGVDPGLSSLQVCISSILGNAAVWRRLLRGNVQSFVAACDAAPNDGAGPSRNPGLSR